MSMNRPFVLNSRRRRVRGVFGRYASGLLLAVLLAACSRSESPATAGGEKGGSAGSDDVYSAERVSCALFSLDDAAAVLGVPVSEIKANAQELYPGNQDCNYNGGGLDKLVGFNLSLSPSSQEAATDMAQYRSHLEIAKGVKPFKDDLADGAYSEVEGLGDEALWTAVNGTLSVRKGNLSLQISLPKERDVQRGIAQKILSRL